MICADLNVQRSRPVAAIYNEMHLAIVRLVENIVHAHDQIVFACVRQSLIFLQAAHIRGEYNFFALLVERQDELDAIINLIPQCRFD